MNRKILIVDDNSTNLYVLTSLLEGEGDEVIAAVNGQDALDKAHATPPDLIVSDILMPVMDGYTFCRRCKADERLSAIPFVFYTATYTDPKDEKFALSLGANRFVLKPQEPEILIRILDEVWEERSRAGAVAPKPLGEEMEFFRQHNEILFSKLENKMRDLETANLQLRGLEEQYRLSFDNVMDIVWTIDTGLKVQKMSPSVEKMLGYKPQELTGRPITDLVKIFTPESAERAMDEMRLVMRGTNFSTSVYQLVAKDGSVKTGEISGSPMLRNGEIVGMGSVIRDITKRKQAEQAMLVHQERLNLAQAAGAIGIFDWDMTTDRSTWTPQMEMIYGIEPGTVEQTTDRWLSLVHPDDVKETRAMIQRYIREQLQEIEIDFRIVRPDGNVRWLSNRAKIYFDAGGKPLRMIGTSVDISDRKQKEEELRVAYAKRQELEFIVKHSPVVVWLWKAVEGWPVEYVSENVASFGYTPDDFTSGRISYVSIIHPDDLPRIGAEVDRYTREGRNEFTKQYRIVTKSSEIRWIDDQSWVRRASDGSITHYQGIMIDITDRKRTDDALNKSFAQLRAALGATVQAIAVTVETRDPYTAGHQRRVADLARSIARELNLSFDQMDGIRMAGIIHDMGKISIPAEILSKPTKLTEVEFTLIKTHPQSGYDILKDMDFPWPIARMILEHHERMNGSGYPSGLRGDQLLIESRILMVADVVEAMASHRPYRPGLGIEEALQEIVKNRGVLYDRNVVDACVSLFKQKGYQLPTI